MVEAAIFIGAMIIAITQFIKYLWPKVVTGGITILVAVAVGALVGLFGPSIGVTAVTPAMGIMIALASVGIHTTASSVNTKS